MLVDIFKYRSMPAVLDYLLDFPEVDFSKADVARECELQWQTVDEIFPLLERYGIIKKSRQIGRAELYKVNEESKALQYLHKFDLQISTVDVDETVEGEKIKVEVHGRRN